MKKNKRPKTQKLLDKLQSIVASQQETIQKLTAQTFENANMRDELNVRRSLMMQFQQEKNAFLAEIAGLKEKMAAKAGAVDNVGIPWKWKKKTKQQRKSK